MKDRSFRKQLYAEKRQQNVSQDAIDRGVLTEEQTKAIESICRLRHDLHTIDSSNLLYYGLSQSDEFFDAQDKINTILSETNLPELNISVDFDSLPNSADYDELLSDEEKAEYNGFGDWAETNNVYEQLENAKEQVNNDIEKWINKIDKKYGTSYSPTGHARQMFFAHYNPLGKSAKMTNARLSRMSRGI